MSNCPQHIADWLGCAPNKAVRVGEGWAHPSAQVNATATIGCDVWIRAGAWISEGVTIGPDARVRTGVVIWPNVTIPSGMSIGPGSTITR